MAHMDKSKHTRAANFGLEKLLYKEEATFTFASFVTKAMGYFDTLGDGSNQKTEMEKIQRLETHVYFRKSQIQIALEVGVTKFPRSFDLAMQHVSCAVIWHNPKINIGGGGKRKAIVS